MSKTNKSQKRSFILEGEFLGFLGTRNQPKFLQLATAQGKLVLKLSKKARKDLSIQFELNQTIQVLGISKLKGKQAKVTLKVVQINSMTGATSTIFTPVPTKVKLLFCQKSSCQNKGSQKQRQAITASLKARELTQSVIIQDTGCLGRCSIGPNVMLMPGKKRLSGMEPDEIASLLAKNCKIS